ncbi:hypothetical protein AAG906_003537 [Vitis piasezkii]
MISIKPKEEEVQHLDDKENAPQEQQYCLAKDRTRRQIKPPQRVLLAMVTLFDLELKTQLQGEFEMKDLGAAKKILGMRFIKSRIEEIIFITEKAPTAGRFTVQNLPPPVVTRSPSLESPLSRRVIASGKPPPTNGGGLAIEGLDVENFGFPNAHFQSPFSNFQNE